jgi:predicted nucleic acid-binding Zn ribbon protein
MCDVVEAMNEPDPVRLAKSLDDVVRSLQGGTPGGAAPAIGGVFGRWGEIVGDTVAAHVQPVRLDGGRLVVEVSDPTWATQIRLLAGTVCARINDVTGTVVDAVDVRVAGPRRRS